MFRLMVSSGVVKLTSNCPTWWGLTALHYHFQTQPLPNGFSWYFHHLPDILLRFGVLETYWIEIITPFLFFLPIRSLRITAGMYQVLLQLLIILSGNYNFFNLLTIIINLSNFDDEFIVW